MKSKIKSKTIGDRIYIVIIAVLFIALCVSLILPLVWGMFSSFKGVIDYNTNTFGLPSTWHFENYVNIFDKLQVTVINKSGRHVYGVFEMFFNSLLYACLEPLIAVLMPAVTSYVCAKYNFKGKNAIYTTAIVTMTLTIVGSLPSQMSLLKTLGIYDNLFLYVLTQNGALGFNFILLYGAWKNLSWTYAEAAQIDGAGPFTIMIRLYFPMMWPMLSTLFIMGFVSSWNNYNTFLIWLPSWPNLFLGMYNFQHQASITYSTQPEIMAGLYLVAIPTIILYFFSQRKLADNFTVGGIKG